MWSEVLLFELSGGETLRNGGIGREEVGRAKVKGKRWDR
jgi:hypothetical protein